MIALLAPFVLAACAQTELAVHAVKQIAARGGDAPPTETVAAEPGLSPEGVPIGPGGPFKIGDPYTVMGARYVPTADPDYDVTGIASWYGDDFHGLLTANGETYDMNALTAAHKTLPMPTYVRITNLENGRSLVLRINDRGPFVNQRIIDVSRRSAQLLGFHRQGTARVRVRAITAVSGDSFVAERPVTTPEERTAAQAAPVAVVETETLAPPEGVEESPRLVGGADPAVSSELVGETNIYIQAGAFANFSNANLLSARLHQFGRWRVTSVIIGGRELYRVRFGPLETVEDADLLLAQVIESGHTDARIIVD